MWIHPRAELTDFIQQLDAEIPIHPELLALVDQALTHVSSGRPATWNGWSSQVIAAARRLSALIATADLAVGACSNLRAQLVSDRWLADVGAALGIEQHLLLGQHAQGIVPQNPGCEPMPPSSDRCVVQRPRQR